MMQGLLYMLFRPDFMQGMLVITALLLLPLNKKTHWRRRLCLAALVSLLINLLLSYLVYLFGWFFPVTPLYYAAPLAASLILLWLCADIPFRDAVYGLGCAYAIQHIAFCITTILWGERWELETIILLAKWLVLLAVSAICYLLFMQKLSEYGVYQTSWRSALLHTGSVIVVAMVLNRVVRQMWEVTDPITYTICLTYDLCCCLLILILQQGQHREMAAQKLAETERGLRRKAQAQYELSRDTIDIIDQKCHDLKHQVSALRLMNSPEERESSLREIESLVMVYDTAAKTGNDVLDTVLTEKGLLCEKDHITYSCMADGSLLEFMSPVDLYIMMGNALDNAIESSAAIKDPQRRVIRVNVRQEHGAAFIQIENYYDHPIRSVQGLPVTTKADNANHGFGLKSIRSTAERYGGTVDIEHGNGTFLLSILIPLPKP